MGTHILLSPKILIRHEYALWLLSLVSILTFFGSVSSQRGSVQFILEMPLQTELLWSNFGYFDPKDKSRQEVLNPYEELYEEGYEKE
jgi:hypothetical protein